MKQWVGLMGVRNNNGPRLRKQGERSKEEPRKG